LRIAGQTYDEIAGSLGYADKSGAWKAVERALKDARLERGRAVLDLQVLRIERASRALMPGVEAGDPAAISAMLRVQEREAKILKLDAVKEHEHLRERGRTMADAMREADEWATG
jgi:hypothetical protein